MSKIKINVNDLVIGMYVSELDRPWKDTAFLFQGFRITNNQELDALTSSCDFVYVDEEKSTVDISAYLSLRDNLNHDVNISKPEPLHNIEIIHKPYLNKFEDEFPVAKTTYEKSTIKIRTVFNDVRLGKSLDIVNVKATVKTITDSILRNPDALKLMCVLQERNDNATTHALHVSILTQAFAFYLGLKEEMILQLGLGALLHDIGETKLPEGLFWKSTPYTKEEKKIMQKHTEYGVEIITNYEELSLVVFDIVRDHHERLNCSGFPRQICGADICYNAMIVSIADVYDSVTMGYEGRAKVSCTEVLKSMYNWRNELFPADLIEHFIQCLGIYPIGSVVKLNSGEIGIIVTFDDCSRLAPRIMLLLDKDLQFYQPPRMIDLSKFKDEEDKYVYEIDKVVDPENYDIDIRQHILTELYVNKISKS